jgi:broad specificity polyphosphatase/5'/3'-nucleotidase SurE
LAYRGREFDFAPAAQFMRSLAPQVIREGLPRGVVLNVNVPQDWTGEVRFSRQSSKITRNVLQPGTDPRGRRYYWLSEQHFTDGIDEGTDHAAIRDAAVSITPLHLDHTHMPSLSHLSSWAKPLERASRAAAALARTAEPTGVVSSTDEPPAETITSMKPSPESASSRPKSR